MTVGEFIKQKRVAKGLTIEQLSQLCNSNDSAFSRIENNKREIEFSLLTTLCKVLDFTPNDLAISTGFSPPPEGKPSPPELEVNKELERYEKMVNSLLDIFINPAVKKAYEYHTEKTEDMSKLELLEKKICRIEEKIDKILFFVEHSIK